MIKNITLVFACCVMAACGTSHQATRKPIDPIGQSLTMELDSLYQQSRMAGLGTAIVIGNGPIYQKSFGFSNVATQQPYTVNTIQNIGSISKTFIGIALMKAQELGKLNLDDPINKYLPTPIVHPLYPNTPITIRQLATHTSGISDDITYLQKSYVLKAGQNLAQIKTDFGDEQVFNPADSLMPMGYFLQQLLTPKGKWYNKEAFLPHKPGERFEYTNVGATLAAWVLENATGENFDAFTVKHILQPLRMNASGWNFESVDFAAHARLHYTRDTALPYYRLITYPDGNCISSVTDMSLYLAELIKGYQGSGYLLSKASYAELFRPQLTAAHFQKRNEKNPYSDTYNSGIFMGFSAKGNIGHTGSDPGVSTALFFNPTTGIGQLLIINTNLNDQKDVNDYFGILDKLAVYGKKMME